ncbi:ATPase [Xanthobacter autotrophicus]|uniref:ATPase n=2 Tax=Xanthobacter autotrophicus TaxID=280 RepID=A0A6C1KL09_XANAU|nr:ATPase [Xanthobacter autotrophicus]
MNMTPLDLALDYARRGWKVFPCNPSPERGISKRPLISAGFKAASRDAAQLRAWWTQWPDALIGVPMGRENEVWAIDPDVAKEPGDADGLKAWENIARQHPPIRTHAHLTPSGGKHLLFRWREDRPVTNTERGLRARGIHGINVRGEGGYVIAAGSRLTDGRSYEIEDPMDFFHFAEAGDWLYELLTEPAPEARQSPKIVDFASRQAPPDRYVQTAIAGECWAVAQSGRGERNNRLNTAAFSLGQLVGAGMVDEDTARGSLMSAAASCGLIADDGERATCATIDSGIAAGRLKPREVPDRQQEMRATGTDGGVPAQPEAPRRRISATPWQWVDPKTIPPRRWIYDKHYVRRFVTGTVAPGGVGKSSLIIAEALAISTGRPLLDVLVQEQTNVWYWNGEDPKEELDRRLAGACLHYGIEPADIENRLFIDSGREVPIVIAEKVGERVVVARPMVEEVEEAIRGNDIGTFIVDPFVSSHSVGENDNGAVDRVAKEWARIAERCNCAIELVHHVRKAMGEHTYTVEDARGASALIGAVRSARVLNVMSQDDADRAGIEPEHRRLHFRVDNGKANMSPPMERAVWRRLASVGLGNGEDYGLISTEDFVGVVTAWEMPDALQNVRAEHIEKVVAAVKANPDYRVDVQAGNWIGHVVADVLGLNVDDKADKEKVKRALAMWFASKALGKERRPDVKRMMREFVVVGAGWES